MTIYSGFSHEKWWFSIVMLVYQRVSGSKRKCENQVALQFLNAKISKKINYLCMMLNPAKLQSRTDKLGNSKMILAVLLTRQFWRIWRIWRLGRVRIWHNQSSTKRRMETTMITCENAWFLPRVINVLFNWTLKWGNLCSTRLSSGPKGMFFLWAEGSKLHGSPYSCGFEWR